MKTALIAGATGATGKALLYQLLEDQSYIKVIALTRRPLTVKHHKLTQVQADFNQLNEVADQLQADDVFCCLGTTIKVAGSRENFYRVDHDYVYELAKTCLAGGATQFIMVSALGANADSGIFYNRVKGEIERDVAALNYPAFIIVRPSLLLATRASIRTGEVIAKYLMSALAFLFIGPLKRYKAIPVETVAKAMRHYAGENLSGTRVFLNDALFR